MQFFWPTALLSLVLVPALVLLYLWVQRRRRKYALRYASLSLVREAVGKGPGRRRHVPPALLLAAVALMLVAVARPYAVIATPIQEGTVILAIDVSGSMQAQDVLPNRMEAAKAAAKAFVAKQSEHVRVGIVSFSTDASIVQAPTANKDLAVAAIDRLRPQRATAIGKGILISLDAIFADGEEAPPSAKWIGPGAIAELPAALPAPSVQPRNIPVAAASIVLLTDGQNNQYPPPLAVVDEASSRGVRVYTIGLGTAEGTVIRLGGRAIRTRLDEETLKAIAQATDAQYFNATSEKELEQVYSNLSTELVFDKEKTEVSGLFAAGAAVFTIVAAALSLVWFGRVL